MPSQAVRGWIYRIFTAAVPILCYYGILTEQAAPLWISLAASLCGFGLAAANTPISGDQ
jgi:hypothetical protein